MTSVNDRSQRRLLLAGCAAAWVVMTITIVVVPYRLSGLAYAVILSVLPGLFLFGYVEAAPNRIRLIALGISMLLGLGVLVANSRYMASSGCVHDALCGVNAFNPGVFEVVLFAVLVGVQSSALRRRARSWKP